MHNMLMKILLAILTFYLTPNSAFAGSEGEMAIIDGVVPISIKQAKDLMNEPNTYVFDANTKEVRDQYGYIPKSIFINVDNWENLLPKDKNANLVFYCLNRLCFDSSEAAMIAMQKGYQNSFVMLDGIEKWIIDGEVIERVPGTDNSIIKKILSNDELTKDKITDYKDTIHSQMYFGNLPSCRDCHGVEADGTKEIKNIEKSSKRAVNANCISCHEKDAKKLSLSTHSAQIHPGSNNPSCTDCHGIHLPDNYKLDASNMNIRKLNDDRCGSCHTKKQERYHETFHGKAMILNSPGKAPKVAACADCHGTHNIYPIKDPRSQLSKENRVKTCAQCHPGANENFVSFIAHANHKDKENYPELYNTYIFMTGLLISVFVFFGIHTFFWSLKLIKTKLDHPKEWKLRKEQIKADRIKISRFTPFNIAQHFFMAISFLGLSFSGLPQKFSSADWAQSMINFMGGPIMATKIHHFSAILMIIVFLSHIGEICYYSYKNRAGSYDPDTGKFSWKIFLKKLFGPDSLMPNWQDFKDIWSNFKWFFGFGQRPQFDRWTYWEKFDYLAVFWGMFLIGLSGLVLWFPTFFTKFLPGWMINVCAIAHSDEALLATGFIFAVHFFNTHFRADRFPMDMAIFSGNLKEEEIKNDKMRWYKRLKESGKLEKLIVKDNFESWSWLAKLIGFLLLFTGLIFLFLIIYAFAQMLF